VLTQSPFSEDNSYKLETLDARQCLMSVRRTARKFSEYLPTIHPLLDSYLSRSVKKTCDRVWRCVCGLLAKGPVTLSAVALWALLLPIELRADEPTQPAPPGAEDPPSSAALPTKLLGEQVLPILKAHCFHCHSADKNEAELTLDKYTTFEQVQRDRKLWENVLQMVRTGEMPPKERPRPTPDEIDRLAQGVEGILSAIDCGKPNVGRVTLRRLNRTEYNNTIRDLVGVNFRPADDFPADDVGYGFDNIGDVLSTTPLLFEKYLTAAEMITSQAIVNVEIPEPREQRVELNVNERFGMRGRRGSTILFGRGNGIAELYLDAGDYTIRVEAYGEQAGDEPVKMELRLNPGFREPGKVLEAFDVEETGDDEPKTFEAKIQLPSGTTRIGVALANPFTTEPAVEGEEGRRRELVVRRVVVDGPYNSPGSPVPATHARLMAHRAGAVPREAAREIVSRFADLAFRRPSTPEEIEKILAVYDLAEQEGERFEQRIRLALCRVLVSPHFLFRVERDPSGAKAGEAYPLSEWELASRMSYFLWSTMPDAELRELAGRGQLRANLDAQIQRMIADEKSAALVQNFAGQWLTLRKLESWQPDKETFPQWDDSLRSAMIRETELFFETILRENRSVLEFLDADYTFVNGRLAYHYGIEGKSLGREFVRVPAPAGRGGLLTQGSILTLTSNQTRTAPVKRGKWVLEQLLGTPPPPPPPNVPELPEKGELKGTLRQVLEQHRADPICASCHARMDPIGFAFENFDAVGAFRAEDRGHPIDASGELPGGQRFSGPAELKEILKGKKELFTRALSEKMLTYALGRGLEYYDKCAIDQLVAALEKNDYRFQALIVETIKSPPFQMRTATGAQP
jgi:mono/diheme cytochrome c family protein